MSRGVLAALLLFAWPLAAEPERRVILPGATIKGIEASPRVTFIVPWQRSRMKAFSLLPAHSMLDELYTPLSSQQLELDVAWSRWRQ
ncbi:MAG: hypothetical protein OQL08_09900 [Gammaproteobacteria bacterium]|nr:hypothetical protein [Gammaproteobacteria bacterium]